MYDENEIVEIYDNYSDGRYLVVMADGSTTII